MREGREGCGGGGKSDSYFKTCARQKWDPLTVLTNVFYFQHCLKKEKKRKKEELDSSQTCKYQSESACDS